MDVQFGPKCKSCQKTFSAPRGLKAHQKKCVKHLEQIDKSPVFFSCDACDGSFSRPYDVGRHKRLGQCPRLPLVPSSQTVTTRKHALSAHYEESPSQRMRTASPARDHTQLEVHAKFDVVSCEAAVVPGSQDTEAKLETPVHVLPEGYNVDTTTGELATPGPSDSSSTVGVDPVKRDTLGDAISRQVQPYAEASPSTGSSDSGSTISSAQETPSADGSTDIRILPVTSNGEAIPDVDGMDSLTHGFARASLEVQASRKKRSSFAFSITSSCSATSQFTLPSMRSFLANPSLRHLSGSLISIPSLRSSNMSLRRASTVPSEMPAPMLGQIDEELENSRGLSSRLERYMPGRRHKARQQALHERLWSAVSTNCVEDVIVILASGRGIIDINCPNENGFTPLLLAAYQGHEDIVKVLLESGRGVIDVNCVGENGSTPLLEAAYHGYEGVVTLLLEQEHIDVHRQDSQKWTAMKWAQYHGQSSIVEQLEAYLFYEREKKGKEDPGVDMGGICCEMLALPPKSPDHAFIGTTENQRALWRACEMGDAMKVARLITDKGVKVNCPNPHGRTPLSIAASHGYHVVVSWLLGHDGVNTSIPDANGATALTWAASQGQIRVVQLLLCHEGVAGRNDTIIAASMALAQRNGHKEIVEMLMLDWETVSSLRPVYHASAWTNIT
jgi:ankyrin repeat protein